MRAFSSNLSESGSQLKVRLRGKFQTSDTSDLKLDYDNPELCSHKARLLTQLKLAKIPKFLHMLTQITKS